MKPRIDPISARRKRSLLRAAGLAGLLAGLAVSAAVAQSDLGGKLRTGGDVRVPAGETVDGDLYASGGTVTVDGNVRGDLVTVGGTLNLNGAVGGDVVAAGGTINVNGEVTGDVRSAGGQVRISGSVGEDVVVAGGQVDLASTGRVGEDLILYAGQATVAGTVDGNVTGSAGAYSRTGSVGGTDDVVVAPRDDQGPVAEANPVVDAVRHFVAVLLLGGLVLLIAPRLFRTSESHVRERPLLASGWGLLGFVGWIGLLIVIAIVVGILAATFALLGFGSLVALDVFAGLVAILGLVLAFVLVVGFLVDAIVGLAVVRRFVGDAGVRRGTDAGGPAGLDPRGRELLLLAGGAALVVLVTSLPIIGGLAKLVVAVVGLGAVLLTLWPRADRGRTEAAPRAA